jgi:hypothetical protein
VLLQDYWLLEKLPQEIQLRQLSHFFRADLGYGFGVAKALGIELSEDVVRTLCQPRPATVNWSRRRSAEFALT